MEARPVLGSPASVAWVGVIPGLDPLDQVSDLLPERVPNRRSCRAILEVVVAEARVERLTVHVYDE